MSFARAASPRKEAKNKKLTERAELVSRKDWEIRLVSLDSILENPEQARSYYDPVKMEDLKRSIRKEGILNPPVVYEIKAHDGNLYQVKSGHRRLKAAKSLGWTEVKCRIIPRDRLMEATLSAVSTNHFVDNIHPVDKGVEVNSIIIKLPGSNKERIATIAEYLGVNEKTVAEWHSYYEILPELRSHLVKNNIRTKSKLRKAIKLSRELESLELNEAQREQFVSSCIDDLSSDWKGQDSKIKLSQKTGSSHYVYFCPKDGRFKLRKTWRKLSKKKQRELANFLIECALEIDPEANK